jgi:CheY-like chemotaxis protein
MKTSSEPSASAETGASAEAPAPTDSDPAPPAVNNHGPDDGGLEPLRILVVDDDEFNREVMALLLEPLGATVAMAENGADAVDACAARAFDLVLLDVHMPVMTGIEAAHQIRDDEQASSRARVPIVAVTADGRDALAETCRANGIDRVCIKPVSNQLLDSLVLEARARRAA